MRIAFLQEIDARDEELVTSKENLRNFIERWEEHPNSPYVFDASASLILPTKDPEKASSGFSSRGCSPSPCESLSSNTELFQRINDLEEDGGDSSDPNTAFDETKSPTDSAGSSGDKPRDERFNRPNSSTPTFNKNKDYLLSFDRRHSDSNYVANHGSALEKLSLAEEIKKLSDRLLILSSINAELQDFNQRSGDGSPPKAAASDTPAASDKDSTHQTANAPRSDSPETEKNLKNSKRNESFSKSVKYSETVLANKDGAVKQSKTIVTASDGVSSETVVNDLTERLNELDASPTHLRNGRLQSNDSSASTSPFSGVPHSSSAPWPITSRRTKFRVTQLSRDVPVGSPDSHQTIFLEEAANNTKDCLLHLLEKYNGDAARSSAGIRRHQSISVGSGISDNLEYHSMNSINAFFKRNAFQQSGSNVRKIQTRLESKGKQ